MADCCLSGSQWDTTPKGRETKLVGNSCYVTGSNNKVAILIIHDLFGWTFPNVRDLADHYAEEVDATVYVPDFFGGEVIPRDIILEEGYNGHWARRNLPAFFARNTKDIREQEIFECAQALRSQYPRVGAIGYCFGGWAVFRLGAKGRQIVDCISAAHPSLLDKAEIESIGVPVQILAPEFDTMFTEELKAFSLAVFPDTGVPFDYQFFPGLEHAFAIRGNRKNAAEIKGMERAKTAVVYWFRYWLHAN